MLMFKIKIKSGTGCHLVHNLCFVMVLDPVQLRDQELDTCETPHTRSRKCGRW